MQVNEEMIFHAKVTCPNCGKDFLHPEVKTKYIALEKQDSDLCAHYSGINPIFYDVMICKHCGYGFTKETNIPLSEPEKASINTILSGWHTEGSQYNGLRTLEQAIKAYNLAILCQELRKAKDSVKGSLYLRLGWLYRYQGHKENEAKSLQRALEFLKKAYEKESTPEVKKELRMMYLIGDLSYRDGNMKEAVQWFYAVTRHPEVDRYPVFARMSRARWQEIRAELKQTE